MAIRLDETWDTKNNIEAEGGASFTRKRTADISDSFMPPKDDGTAPPPQDDSNESLGAEQTEGTEPGFPLAEGQLMRLVRSAFSQGSSYQEQTLQPRWISAYNAFNNKHTGDSKYSSARFRGRSRLYRPKTRSTARKKQAEAAAALFSTQDPVIIKATDESNPQQLAGAELISALLRFRLDRSNENHGIPWFMIAMGAHLCALQNGVCVSKQYWEYRKEPDGMEEVPVHVPTPPEMMQFVGQPVMQIGTKMQPKFKTVRDRPRVDLMPPEDVIRDPAGAWENQAQDSAYLILRFPMTVEAASSFLKSANDKSAVQFYDIDDEALAAASGGASDPNNAANIRRARENEGTDRLSDFTVDNAYKQVWLHENFMRIEGKDYVFWTLGVDRMISDAVPVEEAYPEQGGARPIVVGVGALEPFKIDPMSPVESWQELQREMNDLVNLRLDTLKQTIAPLAKVKRGRSVDIRAIQNRSPDTVVYMQDMGDVEFDRPGAVAGESYMEMEKLNADFDDQAGNFSTGSVQTNRQLGETVGGMQMMQSNANAMGEFDLRVWIETWVENVLRQLVKLEQFYESDQNVLAISAKRAKLMQRFGQSAITDEMLNSQVAVSVDVGLGASDPMQSLAKFQQATQIAIGALMQGAQLGMKRDEVIDEVYGKAGYKDASSRFFEPVDNPQMQQMGQQLQQMQGQMQQMDQALKDKQAEYATRIKVAQIGAVSTMARQEIQTNAQREQVFIQAAAGQLTAQQQHAQQMEQMAAGQQFDAQQAQQGQDFQAQQQQADQQFQGQQGDAARQQAMAMAAAKQQQGGPMGGFPGPANPPGGQGGPPPDQGPPPQDQGAPPPEQPPNIHQLLGLTPPAPPPPPVDPMAAIAPVMQTMMMGFKMIAQQMMQSNQQLGQELAAMLQETIASNQQGHDRTAQILAAPKRLVRNPQTGQPEGIVPDLSGVQR